MSNTFFSKRGRSKCSQIAKMQFEVRIYSNYFLHKALFVAFSILTIFVLTTLYSCDEANVEIIEPPKQVLIPLPDTIRPRDIQFLDTLNGWLAGRIHRTKYRDNGGIFKTTDGGISWFASYITDSSEIYSLQFIDRDYGWAYGSRGVILKTTNGGNVWTKYDSRELMYYQDSLHLTGTIYFLNRLEGWIGSTRLG